MSREIKILSTCFFIVFFAYNGVQQFLTSYFSDLGMVNVGFWALIFLYLSLIISNLFSGFIVSRLGVKKSLVSGPIFYSLFIFSLAAGNIPFIFLSSVLLGFAAAILWTAQGMFLVKTSQEGFFGRNSGFFNALFQLGTVAGVIIAGILMTEFSFRNSFLLLGCLPLIGSILFLKSGQVVTSPANLSQNFIFLKRLVTNSYFLKIALIWFSSSIVLASVAGLFPLKIKEHFNLLSVGFILPIFYFLPIVLSYYFGKKSDIKGRNAFLIFSLVLMFAGFLLFCLQEVFSLDFSVFILSFLLVSLGYAIFAAIRFALLGDISSEGNLKYISSLFTLFSNFGYVIIFLFNIYFPAAFVYFLSFAVILTSLIIVTPVLKLNISVIKEKISQTCKL